MTMDVYDQTYDTDVQRFAFGYDREEPERDATSTGPPVAPTTTQPARDNHAARQATTSALLVRKESATFPSTESIGPAFGPRSPSIRISAGTTSSMSNLTKKRPDHSPRDGSGRMCLA